MSTSYCFEKQILAADVLDGRLMAFGVREDVNEDTTETLKFLTDGRNYIWLYIRDDGFVNYLTRFGLANAPYTILEAIATVFDTKSFSEHEPQFWGFDSQEEWDVALDRMAKESDDLFYAKIMKYLRDEPCDIGPTTIGAVKATIAKKLTDDNPQLLLPEMRENLMASIEEIYDRDHAVKVTLTEEDIASALMLGTHEDDMGQA